ncbi:MAG: DNA repair protein RecN [Nitrospiraceae bacterium]|nr:DNA repair protein RecN [Nitrospiraceae bacterium]
MLRELRIKNLAIIDDLTVRFGPGLNVLTGETGAGKSIIVDALGLALGDRGQSDFVKSGEKEGAVQAYFELDDYSILPDIGIDASDGLVLRRVISSGGKSRAYINDTMVTSQTLTEIGKALVDILSQHEHQSLLRADQQRTLLDSFGRLHAEQQRVAALFEEVKALREERDILRDRVRERAHRLDLLQFQTEEISAASLLPSEKEVLEEERKILANLARLHELSDAAYETIYGAEGSVTEQLSKVLSHLREMSSFDAGAEEALKTLEPALPLVDDAALSLRGYRDKYDLDPARLDVVEDRLELIRRLQKKYGDTIEAVLAYRDSALEEMKGLEASDERLALVGKDLEAKEGELRSAAEELSAKRKKTGQKLERMVAQTLKDLAFSSASFGIGVRQEASEEGVPRMGPSGMDRVEFLFSANPGEPLKPLSKIISGGELSRVMLSLRSILADVDSMPVLIFDEVDAGIGGRTAESVGKKLDMISEKHQLLCITHLPQIASYGDTHLKIEKKDGDRRVTVEVRELNKKERQDEIARMLSGTITDISRRHAGELLERMK